MIVPRFFAAAEESSGVIQCGLCPWRCVLAPGGKGRCRVRRNSGGRPELPFSGYVTSLAVDPIEKKPLYHFRPGAEICSAGFAGCNLRCPFCQNWHISQSTGSSGRFFTPVELAASAKETGLLAYTYSEPLVHAEFVLECMKEARKEGIANILVSSGCVNAEAAGEILALTDAANVDLKCFSRETYKNILGGDLSAVLGFIGTALEKGVHLEITTLLVPGLNDNREELDKCRDFIAELESGGNAVPWHLSAYHPAFKWKTPATDPRALAAAAGRAREKLKYVYTGNIAGGYNDTSCPRCGNVIVSRNGYRADTAGLRLREENGKLFFFCAACGEEAPFR